MRCPICKKPVDAASELAPFCSERCKLLDLGNWASGRYVISSPLADEDLRDLEEISGEGLKPKGNGEEG